MTPASIISLVTGAPGPPLDQREILDAILAEFYDGVPKVPEMFAKTRIRQRHLAWDVRKVLTGDYPGLEQRMRAWEEHTRELGHQMLTATLAGRDTASIGSFVMASSTGYAGPGPDVLLAKEFGLRPDLRRTFIGHMGCYAAFNAVKVALDALAARPAEQALVSCVEFSSLHVRREPTLEQAIVHTLFGDAGATLLLAASPEGPGARAPRIVRTHTQTLYPASGAMGLHILDDAFRMHLSPLVPAILAEAIEPFLAQLLEPAGLTVPGVAHWGIHPGGPKIVDVVSDRLNLSEQQRRPSLDILAEYGNCASATILLILERLIATARPHPGEFGVLIGFGPGLTIESILLRF